MFPFFQLTTYPLPYLFMMNLQNPQLNYYQQMGANPQTMPLNFPIPTSNLEFQQMDSKLTQDPVQQAEKVQPKLSEGEKT